MAAQLVGAFIGVLFAPGVYAFYTHSFDVGVDYEYSVPYAKVRVCQTACIFVVSEGADVEHLSVRLSSIWTCTSTLAGFADIVQLPR